MTYKLPSGLASFETTGGTMPTDEWTLPGRAADRNKALREALKECHRLQSERDALVDLVNEVAAADESMDVMGVKWFEKAQRLIP